MDELARSQERLLQVLDATADGIIIHDRDGAIQFANAAACAMFGWVPGEWAGLKLDTVSTFTAAEIAERRARFDAQQTYVEQREYRRKNGERFWARLRAVPLADQPDGKLTRLAIITDLSAEQRADGAELLLGALIEATDEAILTRTLDGKLLTVNQASEKLTGYSRSELIGMSVNQLRAHPMSIDSVRRYGSQAGAIEDKLRCKDGTVRDVRATMFPLPGPNGEPTAAGVVLHDLTREREQQLELQRVQDQLHASQKLEALGSLAGGIAHDFNNVLTVILATAHTSAHSLPAGSPIREDLDDIRRAADRAHQMVRQLLAFSRKQLMRPEALELGPMLESMLPMLQRLLGEQVELSLRAAPGLPRVLADRPQLEQVVMNLCVNARDAMPDGGRLSLELDDVALDQPFVDAHLGARAGRHVKFSVRDTGSGMTDEVRERIFEPFFSTKGDKGTGLGLSTVFGIVKQTGGTIWVDSALGKGTRFDVYLPVTDEAASAPKTAVRDAERGSETILLVEDDTQVRKLLTGVLRQAGYTVIDAASPGDAILIAEQDKTPIHLLLTDVVMPRMNGRQLAGRIVELRPNLSVLFMSGYTDDAIVHHGVLERGLHFIEKPMTPKALLLKVREVLGAPAAPALGA